MSAVDRFIWFNRSMTRPQDAWRKLLKGNERFRTGNLEHPNRSPAFRETLSEGQAPFCVILSCSDSRITSEIIFDQGLGDLFIVRTAGHVLGDSVIGSIVYAVEALRVPLIVIMGHTHCGAISATVSVMDDGSTLPPRYIRSLVGPISFSVTSARAQGLTTEQQFTEYHTRIVADELLEASHIIAQEVEAGNVAIVCAVYNIESGAIQVQEILGNVTDEIIDF